MEQARDSASKAPTVKFGYKDKSTGQVYTSLYFQILMILYSSQKYFAFSQFLQKKIVWCIYRSFMKLFDMPFPTVIDI